MKKMITLVLVACMLCAMMVPALAANFTPSVSGKPAPVLKPLDEDAMAIIRFDDPDQDDDGTDDGDDNEDVKIPFGALIITPVSEKDEAPQAIKETLEWAYEDIKSKTSLSELSAADEINSALEEMGKDLTVDDMVVRDLFDARLVGIYEDMLPAPGKSIEICFDLQLDPDQTLIVISSLDNETWYCVDPANVVINEDGSVTVRFAELCAIAFLVDGAEIVIDPNAEDTVVSPQTGEF